MPVKKICEKKVGNITYILKLFEGDNQYIVYKWDEKIMKNGQDRVLPEIAKFNNEEDAKKYLKKL